MTMTQANGMTAAAEVWTVDEQGGAATLKSGVYGSCEAMRLAGEGLTLRAGEGLVGAVLAREVPVLLTELDEESFERCDAAKASGIGGAVAVPVFDESRLTSVALLMLRASGMTGAIELWAGRRGRFELGLAETFAPGLERFAKLSRYVGFPKGSGLPGLVWETSRPRLLRGIGTSNQFLRSSGAETSGLTTGFGYPVRRGNELLAVVLWLSSSVSPLARRHELWETPDGSSAGLKLTDVADANADEHRHGALEPFVREAGETRRPVVFDAAGLSVADGDNAVSAGIALPVLVHDRLGAVGVLAW